jgi:pimeloyl-ACP methyl ester carboxylesterase
MSERFVDVQIPDGRLRVGLSGSGPSVLCLHGLSASHHVWRPVARLLSDRFSFYLPDLLSRGKSTAAPNTSYALDDELRRLQELLGGLAVGPEIIAGHSTGAALAIALASRKPGVRGLLLVNPVTPWTRRPVTLGVLRSALMRHLASGIIRPFRRPLTRWVLDRVGGPDHDVSVDRVRTYSEPYANPLRALALMRILADWRPIELAAYLKESPPVAVVLAGDHDPRIDPESAARLAERLGASFDRVDTGGHALPEEEPERVARALVAVYRRSLSNLRSDTERHGDQERPLDSTDGP